MLLAAVQSQAPAEAAAALNTGEEILWLFVGVLFSVVIPIAAKTLRSPEGPLVQLSRAERARVLVVHYAKIGAAAFVIAAFTALIADYSTIPLAVLAGYAWDSTLQKLTAP